MCLVVKGRRACCLRRARDHEPLVFPYLSQVGNELGVTCVEPDPQTGQVGALGQRVNGQHPLGAVLENRPGRSDPGELQVALIGGDGHAVGPSPFGSPTQVVQGAGWVGGGVHPEAQGPRGIVLSDGREVDPPPVVDGHRNGPATGQLGPHGVGRVGHRGVEDRVAPRGLEAQDMG